MSRAAVVAVVSALLAAVAGVGQADAKRSCKKVRVHGRVKKACKRKKAVVPAPKPVASAASADR